MFVLPVIYTVVESHELSHQLYHLLFAISYPAGYIPLTMVSPMGYQ
jgi:hypothetical protein